NSYVNLKIATCLVRYADDRLIDQRFLKHNYVAYMDKSDAPTALSRLAIAFEHYNERHPHKALKYRSPREFRRNAVSST
ncbi:integrase core domain-containing protein, partial [Burkholderia multivorans]|uniref:integrase core domain-containing protein n=1 Tax=Burkholderia multivorans TaxID=87883 RepID=UPI002159A674